MTTLRTAFGKATIGAGLAAALLLGACASAPPRATEEIARARVSVERAERAGASHDAASELNIARDKLQRAQSADDKGLTISPTAKQLAVQAELDAQVAEAQARADVADKDAADLAKNLSALREESQR